MKLSLTVGLVLSLLAPLSHAEPCVKQVFQQFCLGGTDADVVKNAQVVEGKPYSHELKIGQYTHQLQIADGRLEQVTRLITPGDWLLFKDWKAKLNRVYGSGQLIENLPAFASSRSSRRNAIISGRGRLHLQWPQEGWRVSLIWDSIDHLKLTYELDATAVAVDNPEGL